MKCRSRAPGHNACLKGMLRIITYARFDICSYHCCRQTDLMLGSMWIVDRRTDGKVNSCRQKMILLKDLLLLFLIVTCSCCPYLYFGSPIMWVTYLGSWMTICLRKSCSFGLHRLPSINCCQFIYLVISLLVLRAWYGIWLYQFLIIAYLFTLDLMFWIVFQCDQYRKRKRIVIYSF